jgi:hypothetical protein
MWKRLHVKCPLFLSDFNETWIFSTDFRKSSNIKFHQSPSSGRRVVPCEQTEGRTDMTKLTVAFRNFASAPRKGCRLLGYVSWHICVWVQDWDDAAVRLKRRSLRVVHVFVHVSYALRLSRCCSASQSAWSPSTVLQRVLLLARHFVCGRARYLTSAQNVSHATKLHWGLSESGSIDPPASDRGRPRSVQTPETELCVLRRL